MSIRISSILLFLILAGAAPAPDPVLQVTYPKAHDGTSYTRFAQNDLRMSFEISRPSKNERNVLLCIPAAFTATDSGGIQGFFMQNGKVFNRKRVNRGVGGGCAIVNGKCRIFPTGNGKLINDSLVSLLVKQKASFFQQIQIITDGVPATFKDKSLFQRRAIMLNKEGKCFVIESHKPLTLEKFSKDLADFGAWNALYTDMGAWDEGWFRDEKHQPVTIGKILTATERQSNWITFRATKPGK